MLNHLCRVHFHEPAVKRFWAEELVKAMGNLDMANDEEDDGKFDAKDVELVMIEARVTREKAVKSLKDNRGDLVGAIVSLIYE